MRSSPILEFYGRAEPVILANKSLVALVYFHFNSGLCKIFLSLKNETPLKNIMDVFITLECKWRKIMKKAKK